MNWQDALNVVYTYRHTPDFAAIPALFAFTLKEGLLRNPETSLAWAGVITGLYDYAPLPQREIWKTLHPQVINDAFRFRRAVSSSLKTQWVDHLMFRWIIGAKDRDAWAVLLLAHDSNKTIKDAAQTAIQKICQSLEGVPIVDTQGTVRGKVMFEDLRLQITSLAKEFSAMTWDQRRLPFDSLPFSPLHRLPVSGLIQ